MITLYQAPPVWGVASGSPFCVKLETYLRMAGLPFQINYNVNPLKAPTGKMPYIEQNGQLMGDSGLIIEHLEAQASAPLDAWLTPHQKAQALAIRRMIEEHLYFGLGYSRWAIDTHWVKVRQAYFGSLPPVVRKLVPALLRKKMLASIKGQGLSRHPDPDLYRLCNADLQALAELLGDQPYLMGDRPCSLDACAYGFLTNLLWVPFEDPLKAEALRHPQFEAYCQRIKAAYFSQPAQVSA